MDIILIKFDRIRKFFHALLLLAFIGSILSAFSKAEKNAGPRIIHFSGYDWEVREGHGSTMGPGPNYFAATERQVWLDEKERLHLAITEDSGQWNCAELTLTQSLGYGTYSFEMVDSLDPNIVAGLFTYENDSSEIDIEFSRWAKPENEDAQFVLQPGFHAGNHFRYRMPGLTAASIHSFVWQPRQVDFLSVYQNGQTQTWTYTGADIPISRNREKLKINFWLFRGKPPTNGQKPELIISAFHFTPASSLSK